MVKDEQYQRYLARFNAIKAALKQEITETSPAKLDYLRFSRIISATLELFRYAVAIKAYLRIPEDTEGAEK